MPDAVADALSGSSDAAAFAAVVKNDVAILCNVAADMVMGSCVA